MQPSSALLKNATILLCGMALACFVLRYVGAEQPVYAWDWGDYFAQYIAWGELFSENTQDALRSLMAQIRSDDYNGSYMAFLTPFYFILGPDRAAYVFGIVFTFLVPACCMSYYLSKLTFGEDPNHFAKVAVCFFIFLFPPFWQCTLRGMPDIIGLIPLGLASIILLKTQFLQRDLDKPILSMQQALLIGLLLWITFLFRRWYAYSAVALLGCAFLLAILQTWAAKKSFGALVDTAIPYVVAGLVGLAGVFLFQSDLANRIARSNYSYQYGAYQAPLLEHLFRCFAHSGPIFAGFFVTGLTLAIWKRRMAQLFLVAVALISGVLLGLTQAPGVQHHLPVVFFLMPTAVLPIFQFLKLLRLRSQIPALAIIVATSIIVFMSSFSASFPRLSPIFPMMSPLSTFPPLHYKQFSEYQRLIAYLHKTLTPTRKAVVIASNQVLSASLLYEIDHSLDDLLVQPVDLDERDGLPISILTAEFAVIASPTPLHAPVTSQRVVAVPSEMIRSGTGIGVAYKQIAGPFELEDGHKGYVYQRTRPLNGDDIRAVDAALKSYHPDWVWTGSGWVRRPGG